MGRLKGDWGSGDSGVFGDLLKDPLLRGDWSQILSWGEIEGRLRSSQTGTLWSKPVWIKIHTTFNCLGETFRVKTHDLRGDWREIEEVSKNWRGGGQERDTRATVKAAFTSTQIKRGVEQRLLSSNPRTHSPSPDILTQYQSTLLTWLVWYFALPLNGWARPMLSP